MFKAAQINGTRIVVGISELKERFTHPDLVWLSGFEGDVMGKRYNPSTGAFVEVIPEPEPEPDYGTKISRLAFKLRMTADERKAIRVAAESNADLFDFMDLLSDSTYIDLSRAETIAGVGQLEAAGLLAPGRGDDVLNATVTEEEQWNG